MLKAFRPINFFLWQNNSAIGCFEVYGLASAKRFPTWRQQFLRVITIQSLNTDDFENGLDFYRALLDLSDQFRQAGWVIETNEKTGNSEAIARILDELREGETLVRSGLSEKANFEVTLFRAVESGRTRSIDQVIRKISQIIPTDTKKKTNLKPPPAPLEITSTEPSVTNTNTVKAVVPRESPSSIDKEIQGTSEPSSVDLSDEPVPVEDMAKEEIHLEPSEPKKKKTDLQVTDPEKIKSRMEKLPTEVRELIDEKFRGEYFSIEKIDRNILI